MKKLSFILILLLTVSSGLYIGAHFFPQKRSSLIPVSKISPQPTSETQTVHPATPVSLSIPKLQVNAQVESVAMDEKGNMDVPKKVMDVAWYNLGAKPGEAGNAVIAGHLDTVTGAPAVFYKLAALEPGDTITVTDAMSKSYTYTVIRKQNYPYDSFPLQEVFGVNARKRLNLITCEGTFDQHAKNYSHRTVVYAELSG